MLYIFRTHRWKMFLLAVIAVFGGRSLNAQQGFFLNGWNPKVFTPPAYNEILPVSDPVTVSVTISATDTVTKIPAYVFGDNANAYTSSMSENKMLMNYLSDRNMGVLRGPSGSISDVYFWNRNKYQPPLDVPETLMTGGDNPGWEWYGKRPDSWDAGWTMDIDSFYRILSQAHVTGMLTVNYGYARYGTSADPVARAAHMAADWVRYDKGRTKFWEIGNEVFGNWEAGYRINTSLNQDGQPEYITGTLYGKHCRVFIDSMKAAANQIGVEIFIGAVAVEGATTGPANWNVDMMKEVGDDIDFYIIHSYYTPYQQNSNADVILKAPEQTRGYMNYLNTCVSLAGKQMKPVALTEYNTFAAGSNQNVSQIGGMFAVLVTGESIKAKLGAALRWDLANGYSNGDDHGMYSNGDEPGVTKFSPRPAFYYLYYMQKCLGDVLLSTKSRGTSDVKVYSSAFSTGHISTVLINRSSQQQVVRLNFEDATVGERFYAYTLTGGTDVPSDPLMPFSRKVYVNGEGPTGVAGGPLNYKSLEAQSGLIGDELLVKMPPFTVSYVIADTGSHALMLNDTVYPVVKWNQPADIVYGTNLSYVQLNATANISGTFNYNPVSGTKLNAGVHTLTLTFTPVDTNITGITKNVMIRVVKATPVLVWNNPADIPYGAALGENQLNARTNIVGSFVYNPPAGTIPEVGTDNILKVTFIPSDTLNYSTIIDSVSINVYEWTGLEDRGGKEINIYPVPATDKLVVTGLARIKESFEIRILSSEGTMVYQEFVQDAADSKAISTVHLPVGIYLLDVISGQKHMVRKFSKQ